MKKSVLYSVIRQIIRFYATSERDGCRTSDNLNCSSSYEVLYLWKSFTLFWLLQSVGIDRGDIPDLAKVSSFICNCINALDVYSLAKLSKPFCYIC
jgi:hypothetical protein